MLTWHAPPSSKQLQFFFNVTSLTFCDGYSIESFTMTAGKTLSLTGLADGTTVNLLGDVTFGVRYEYSLYASQIISLM